VLDATLTLDPDFVVAPVRRETFGGFVEHLGRCVYTGVFEPDHPDADADGFRQDVLNLVRELRISSVRYPGGNFVSGYRWEDGIGPVEQRPRRLDLAWHSTETNEFGLDEFMKWAKVAGVEPMMAVNLGTRGLQEALDLLEYCNVHSGTHFSDLRRRNGSAAPYDVRMWCLGNEMDGPWQTGHTTALEYGRLAAATARAMRQIDPDLTLVACGSSGPDMPTFGAWEATVLEETYDDVDLLSAHAYFSEKNGDLASFLASGVKLDAFIEDVTATIDHVRARKKASKRINISFDEWNVWYLGGEASKPPTDEWPVAPHLLEDRYHVADAVVVGGLLIGLLRHSDRVASASIAQLVNVIAPVMTEPMGPAWKQTIYHPFFQASTYASGSILHTPIKSAVVDTPAYGPVPALDAVATYDGEANAVTIMAVNRSPDNPLELTVQLRGFTATAVLGATALTDADPYRTVGPGDADSVAPVANPRTTLAGSEARIVLPPMSWNVLRLSTDAVSTVAT
jgi:alpha-N-arabinofuranosidase